MTDDDHEDLAILELTIRSMMADAGVQVARVYPATRRPPDVYFVYPATQPGALVDMFVSMSPATVFVDSERFDAEGFETTDDGLREAAQTYDGEVRQVNVLWARDGLLYEWLATADWHDELLDEAEIAQTHARGIEQMEYELALERSRNAHQKLAELVLGSPEFRGATTNRRTAQAQLTMNAHEDLVADLLFESRFVTNVRRNASIEVARWERELGADEQLPAQIAAVLDLRVSQTQQKRQVAELLRERADGWALSEAFIDQIWREAREHDR